MLNPALISVILSAAADQHESASREAMPWEYSFIVVPLVLHTPTREALPRSVSTHLGNWVDSNKLALAGLGARATALSPFVREGLRFGLRHRALNLTEDGCIQSDFKGGVRGNNLGDIKAIVGDAGLVGRWFARTDGSTTVFKLLGVTP